MSTGFYVGKARCVNGMFSLYKNLSGFICGAGFGNGKTVLAKGLKQTKLFSGIFDLNMLGSMMLLYINIYILTLI